jgi:MtN3 and saliva related transmembrane protein
MDPLLLLLIGYAAGILTTAAFVPQLVRTWRSRSCRDISYGMLLLFAAGILLWFLYGIGIDSLPVMLANGFTLILVLVLVFFKIQYG